MIGCFTLRVPFGGAMWVMRVVRSCVRLDGFEAEDAKKGTTSPFYHIDECTYPTLIAYIVNEDGLDAMRGST